MLLGHGYFSFDFAENISKFVILRRNIEKIRSFCKFCEVGLNVQRVKIELKKFRSFDMYKNAAALMTAILDYSEVDIEVSDEDMETMKSNGYRRVSGDNEDANGVLAVMWEGARFSCKDRWKFIDLFIQSIGILC